MGNVFAKSVWVGWVRVAFGGLLLAGALAVPGCHPTEGENSTLTQRNFDRIAAEMTCQDVVGILGEPTEKGPLPPSGDITWIWRDGEKVIEVDFTPNGQVLSHGRLVIKRANNLD